MSPHWPCPESWVRLMRQGESERAFSWLQAAEAGVRGPYCLEEGRQHLPLSAQGSQLPPSSAPAGTWLYPRASCAWPSMGMLCSSRMSRSASSRPMGWTGSLSMRRPTRTNLWPRCCTHSPEPLRGVRRVPRTCPWLELQVRFPQNQTPSSPQNPARCPHQATSPHPSHLSPGPLDELLALH